MKQTDLNHYFDWAATSPSDEDILRMSLSDTLNAWGNPSSIHSAGKEARTLLESARSKSASALGVPADKLYFTSGGTESDHIPLLSVLNRPQHGTVLLSAIEHPALREMGTELKKCGWNIVSIPSDSRGIITPQAVSDHLTEDTVLVCVMAVNNETGAIQPIYEIADMLVKAGTGRRRPKLHVDCVQAAGKIPLDLKHKGIDSAAFSAHKICGPRGIGLLYLADPIDPFLRGGGQENTIRSGTENVSGAIAFSKCLERYIISHENQEAEKRFYEQKKLTQQFITRLADIHTCMIVPPSRLETQASDLYSPWIVQAAFRNIPGQVMLRSLDAEGFFISTGSACSSHKQNRPVLEAMHIPPDVRETAVRFSFGPHTTAEGMNQLIEKISEICVRFN
jgi:cysteine desulfurase